MFGIKALKKVAFVSVIAASMVVPASLSPAQAVTQADCPNIDDVHNYGAGNDQVYDSDNGVLERNCWDGEGGSDYMVGDLYDDKIWGGPGADAIGGNEGDDVLRGNDGDDVSVNGFDGQDTVYGGSGSDNVTGGANDDVLYDGTQNDNVTGGSGSDLWLNCNDDFDTQEIDYAQNHGVESIITSSSYC